MATRTWKLGEVCQGGIITVNTTDKKVTIIGKEWDMSTGTRKSSDQSNAKEFTRLETSVDEQGAERKMDDFLDSLTTSYHADQILAWIKTKVTLKTYGW